MQRFNDIKALWQHIADDARIHGMVTDSGPRPNVVPARAAAQSYVRAEKARYRNGLVTKTWSCAAGAASATGTDLQWQNVALDTDAILPNQVLPEILTRHLKDPGYPLDSLAQALVSTDMDNVFWEMPSVYLFMRIVHVAVAGHSRQCVEAACSAAARPAMLAGAKAMAATAIDLWADEDLMARVGADFVQGTREQRRMEPWRGDGAGRWSADAHRAPEGTTSLPSGRAPRTPGWSRQCVHLPA